MDLTTLNFANYLPWVLNELSVSCFVAFDLELSGIAMNTFAHGGKTQTVQERYQRNKDAAEKYQILQIGLTLCLEDNRTGTYTLKPYNINLNPIVNRDLDINRDWNFMGWSVQFLLGNHFSIDALCKQGVHYLSRDEETQAWAHANIKVNRTDVVDVKETDQETLDFLKAVRHAIDNWLAQGEKRSKWLNLPPASQTWKNHPDRSLPNSFGNMHKRLVHQLVNAEYPDLGSESKKWFVQVTEINPEMKQKIRERRLEEAKARVRKHVGFRWIVEALVGGDLTGLEPHMFAPLIARQDQPSLTLMELADRLKMRLKENRPVLVGHNCFTDLVFFYNCFIGPLPDTLEEFQTLIHGIFPVLIDTKYLATYDCGSMNPESSLEDVNRLVAKVSNPKIEVDSVHSKYLYQKSTHEAGYDSMLAAIAFIRLGPQLHTEGKMPKGKEAPLQEMEINIGTSQIPYAQDLLDDGPPSPSRKIRNIHYRERDPDESEYTDESIPPSPVQPLSETGDKIIADMVHSGHLIPRLGSEFWEVYGNKLRVFGTEERVVCLGGPAKA